MSSHERRRVVVTGLGVVAPNAHGLEAYAVALREGRSGIRHQPKLAELGFACQVAGIPTDFDAVAERYFHASDRLAMNSNMLYASVAGIDCWRDAGLPLPETCDGSYREQPVDWDTGAIVGCGVGGLDTVGGTLVPRTDAGQVRRLGSTIVEQIMSSSVSARLAGFLALGGQVTTNSSACTTGTEAFIDAYRHIREGRARRMIAGGSEGSSPYIWAGFDAMRVLSRGHNHEPERASRPLSRSASGFVPASGAGLLMLESLESATERGARIYAEVLGGEVNCGGQRGGGSITAPHGLGVQRCIRGALADASLAPEAIDAISGHLTATMADVREVYNWSAALGRPPDDFPWINATKSLIGHGLGAAGGIELVAAALELHQGFLHPSMNCEDLHPELEPFAERIPQQALDIPLSVIAKASFGFGDVNACVLLRRWG